MAKTSLPIRKKVYAMKIDAGHDTSGNPRRGWLLYDSDGYYLGFVDEGYSGRSALKKGAPKAVELGSVPTTAGTYRDANKDDLGLALIRKGYPKKRKAKSRKKPSKSRKAKLRKAKSRKAKSRAKGGSRAKKTKRVKTTGGYRYMVNGKFVKKAVYDRAVGSKSKSRKTKSRKKGRSKAKSRAKSKAKNRAKSRKTKRVATSRGYRYMVDGKFASKEKYDLAMGKKARKAKSKAKRAKSRAKSRAKGRSKLRKGRTRR